jgi:hypothetical protein
LLDGGTMSCNPLGLISAANSDKGVLCGELLYNLVLVAAKRL